MLIQARLNKAEQKGFDDLKEMLNLKDTYGEESKTIKEAIKLSKQYLKTKEKIKKEFFPV